MPNVVDKYTPTYDLESFKKSKFDIRQSALLGAAALGFGRTEIHDAVKSMTPQHFYKSMTSYNNHRLWQDVYHVPYKGVLPISNSRRERLPSFPCCRSKRNEVL